jgi:indolepyruvate ferredoxin oxidoreductase alpha subunit
MTGHQPTPGLSYNVMSDNLPQVMPEDIARGCGVKHVEVADGNNLKDIRTKMKRLLESDGVGVLVSRAPCILVENRMKRKKGEEIPHYEIDQEQCNVCRICIDKFACPAFYVKDDRIWIADDLCNGCGACLQVCGRNAIRRKK